jgi:hypothetical protein
VPVALPVAVRALIPSGGAKRPSYSPSYCPPSSSYRTV